MNLLFLGDIVGKPGRRIVERALAALREREGIDLVVANAENATGGSGLDKRCYAQLRASGIDAITMGDHIYKRKEICALFGTGAPICRPANYPPEAPGPDHLIVETPGGTPVAVINLLGRVFMKPVDCPFRAADRLLEALADKVKVVLVDVHAEATSDKQLLARYLAGRVSAVLGTHTHVPTADATILPPGTAYITDVGMTGPYDGIIGRRYEPVLHVATTFEPKTFDVATRDPRISGALIDVDAATGRARAIELVHLDEAAVDALVGTVSAEP